MGAAVRPGLPVGTNKASRKNANQKKGKNWGEANWRLSGENAPNDIEVPGANVNALGRIAERKTSWKYAQGESSKRMMKWMSQVNIRGRPLLPGQKKGEQRRSVKEYTKKRKFDRQKRGKGHHRGEKRHREGEVLPYVFDSRKDTPSKNVEIRGNEVFPIGGSG